MNKLYVSLLFVAMLVPSLGMTGAERKKNKKKSKTEQTETAPKKKPESKYDKLLKKGSVQTAKGDFVTVHQVGQKIYFEYPLEYMGREVLLGSTVKSTSDALLVVLGYKSADTKHLKFELQDSSVLAVFPTTAIIREAGETSTDTKALDRAYTPKFYKSFPVAAYNNDSTAVVFDATALLKNKDLNPYYGVLGNMLAEKPEAFSFNTVKAFSDNISVEVRQHFDAFLAVFSSRLSFGDVTANSVISMLLLPEKKMKPRIHDSRVGVFPTFHPVGMFSFAKTNFTAKDGDGAKFYHLANRWKVEPVNKTAWECGVTVDVEKPIVWYVDDAFPEEWRAAIQEGVLVWNQAFEKIGLKNVMQVRDFPTVEEDPDFDPDNLKYSCIRYVPSNIANGMGPSWTDPQTGEILNASVIIWSEIANQLNEWRFIQTAQVDERVRGKKLPPEVMHEAMTYVIAHEIGHTLGLMHNMSASHAYPVDSLRSATFTAKYGTTPSIMDYARNNYVAQPEDKGVRLTPPDLGVYDEYAIKWLYSPVEGDKTMWEESKVIGKWVDEKAGDPLYRYGAQQARDLWDPSSITEDLGDDPVKAGTYGIKNLKYILANLDAWSGEEDDIFRRASLYKQLCQQYNRYLMNVFVQVGGVRLTNVKPGTSAKPHELVSKADQKRAITWLVKELRNCSWLDNPELLDMLPAQEKHSFAISQAMGRGLSVLSAKRVLAASSLATGRDVYRVKELYEDIYAEAFRPTLQGKVLSTFDKTFQKGLLADVSASVGKAGKAGAFSISDNTGLPYYPSLEELRLFGLVPVELLDRFKIPFEEAEREHGKGSVAKALLTHQFTSFTNSMPIQLKGDLNELMEAQLAILKKINSLAKSKMTTAPAADRTHYELLYKETQKALKID